MYFNQKNDTNIDDQFKKESNKPKINNIFTKYKKFFFILILIIIIVVILLVILLNKNNGDYLVLNGEETVTIYQGADYIEPGYKAYNSKKEDLTENVTIESNLNNNVIGEYEIIYKVGNVTKTRYIKIIQKPQNYTYIHLNAVNANNTDITIKKGTEYKEPGYLVFTSTGEDLTSKVVVTGEINTSKEGEYILTYSVVDSSNVTISVKRKVIVVNKK